MLSILKATAVAFAGLALAPSFVHAHTTADPDEGTAGGYQRTAFRITHGCKGSPTTAVTIRMPDGVVLAKPMPKPGWTLEIKTRPLATPVDSGHGFKVREAVSEVTWRGGRLENAQFDEFVVMLRLPDLPEGKTPRRSTSRRYRPAKRARTAGPAFRLPARTGTTCPSPHRS